MRRIEVIVVLLAICGSGCAFQNAMLSETGRSAEYRLASFKTNTVNSDSVFVILSFSGGGTRAAAFSYGVLKELSNTRITAAGKDRRLLDEVDIISSVSGGSFTAAYFALYRDRLFEDFEKQFLKKNVELGLALRVFAPWNWPRLASPYFDRIDLAAEYYDALLFHGQTFNDLVEARRRPYVVLNATDMSLGSRFEFKQEQFNLLNSDLGSYPISRAVAASSAFPILLSPLTLKNYPKGTNYSEPEWIDAAIDPETKVKNPRRFRSAQIARTYENAETRPYIHLLDGGLSDNVGLRGPTHSILSTDGQDSILRMINNRQIRKVAVIHVDAKTGSVPNWDRKKRAPGLVGMISTVTSAPMENYSEETIQSLNEEIKMQFLQPRKTEQSFVKWLQQHCPDAAWPQSLPDLDFYEIGVSFDDVESAADREKLKALPTNYHLSNPMVELLEETGAAVLRNSADFKRLVRDLQ